MMAGFLGFLSPWLFPLTRAAHPVRVFFAQNYELHAQNLHPPAAASPDAYPASRAHGHYQRRAAPQGRTGAGRDLPPCRRCAAVHHLRH